MQGEGFTILTVLQVVVSFLVACGMAALGFFLKRFVTQNDEKHAEHKHDRHRIVERVEKFVNDIKNSVEDEIKSIRVEVKESNQKHEKHNEALRADVQKMTVTMAEMRGEFRAQTASVTDVVTSAKKDLGRIIFIEDSIKKHNVVLRSHQQEIKTHQEEIKALKAKTEGKK